MLIFLPPDTPKPLFRPRDPLDSPLFKSSNLRLVRLLYRRFDSLDLSVGLRTTVIDGRDRGSILAESSIHTLEQFNKTCGFPCTKEKHPMTCILRTCDESLAWIVLR